MNAPKRKPRKIIVWALVNKDGIQNTEAHSRRTEAYSWKTFCESYYPDEAPFRIVRCEGVLK